MTGLCREHATSTNSVPLDLAALIARGVDTGLDGLRWPTPYVAYEFLSREFVRDVVAAARAAATSPELEAVTEAKLYDMATDLAVIGRLALDVRNTRESGRTPLYDGEHSTWLRFLEESQEDARTLAETRRWHHRKARGATAGLKRRIRRWRSDWSAALMPKFNRHDVLSRNTLLDEYVDTMRCRQIDISPNHRDWPEPGDAPRSVKDTAAAILDAFTRAAAPAVGDDPGLAASVRTLGAHSIERHLAKAWRDLAQVRRLVTGRRAGAVLASGTPKHIGRLFAWQYRQLGRPVYRFAHGGERAFYDDYAWGLAELPFCDRYHCHSRREASLIAKRHADGQMAKAGAPGIEFVSLGSRKHQAIHVQAAGRRRARTGAVMYVAGGYLGEELGDFPARKPPDVLYLEWQRWLLETLRSLGFRVATKIHPKGIFHEARLLEPYSDEVVGGYFDPTAYDVDCYVFDFAGTALLDSLASHRGVVLIDMGVRPMDAGSRAELETRCPVVACSQDERNRFRASTGELRAAIEQASESRGCPEAFYEAYFLG